jgi:hypothetical protein
MFYCTPVNILGERGKSEFGQTHAYTYANSQVPQVHEGGNFHYSLTKGLQLKWGSLGSEKMVRKGE